MTVNEACDLVQQFKATMDFNQAMIIIVGMKMEIEIFPTYDNTGWICVLKGRDQTIRKLASTPLAAIRTAMSVYFLGEP